MICPDCKGSGKYVGLLKQEDCLICDGSGKSNVSIPLDNSWKNKEYDIIIGSFENKKKIVCKVYNDLLGVHTNYINSSKYVVDHVPTGLKFSEINFDTINDAKYFAELVYEKFETGLKSLTLEDARNKNIPSWWKDYKEFVSDYKKEKGIEDY